jgi:translation initiation factor 1 (eIF-1/SUI1)
MATVLEGCTSEEERSVVIFERRKDTVQRILIKKCFLFTAGSVCRVKRLTNESINISLMTKRLKRRCGSG